MINKMFFSKGRVDYWNRNLFRFDNVMWKLLLTFNLKSYIAYDYKFEIVKLLPKTVERFSIPADNCRLCLDALISMFDSKSQLTFGENKKLREQLVTYRNSLLVEKNSEQAESKKIRPTSEKWWKINFLDFVWLFTVS